MKIGILGAGGIAVQMAKTVAGMKDVENYAVAARSLERAQAFGADAVVVACPLCHMNLDLRPRQAVGGSMKMPVLYFTQLMGLALCLPHQELGFEKLCVSPDELLRKIDAAQAAKAAAAKADEATEEAKA